MVGKSVRGRNLFLPVIFFDKKALKFSFFCAWQKCTLKSVTYIFDGHLCRSQTLTRDAATFDLKTTRVKSTFHGILEVTLDAAKVKKLCCIFRRYSYCSVSEMVALQIPRILVSNYFSNHAWIQLITSYSIDKVLVDWLNYSFCLKCICLFF